MNCDVLLPPPRVIERWRQWGWDQKQINAKLRELQSYHSQERKRVKSINKKIRNNLIIIASENGMKQKEIAFRFNLTPARISQILKANGD